ncbi:MAG: hypothetical protein E7580_03025 [Ruminococcaceae bacterium]|nr:hypothetical protein [Oscillospiraceae bacterium]
MLTRLMKYDLKKNFRFLCVFMILALFFGVLTRVLRRPDASLVLEIIEGICNGTAISMMFSLMINCFMRTWVSFKASMFGDESYLTHTLPVKRETHYAAKAFTAAISVLLCFTMVLAVIGVTYLTESVWESLKVNVDSLALYFDIPAWTIPVFLFILLFLEFFNIIQIGFTGLIVGHRLHQSKVLWSVLIGFGTYLVTQGITLAGMFLFGLLDSEFMKVFEFVDLSTVKPGTVISLALIGSVFYAGFCIAGFVLNTLLLKKGVNVD